MDQYSLLIEANIRQFEEELRDVIDETPRDGDNRMFILEGAMPNHPHHADIVMIVFGMDEPDEVPPEGRIVASVGSEQEREPDEPRRVGWWPTHIAEEVRPAIQCRYFQHAPPVLRVSIACVDERAAACCARLVQELDLRWPGAWQRSQDVDKATANTSKPTEKTRLRAEVFKRLKDAHPEWGYDVVAQRANDELKTENITADTVRNAYKAMGWTWERADRIR